MKRKSSTIAAAVLAFFAVAAPVLAQADVALAAPGDPVATLSVPSTIVEGTGGTTLLAAQVTLDIPAPTSLSFAIATTDGTASSTGSSDFVAQAVNVTFLAGATGPATINIPITTDDVDEADETFVISLTPISGGLDFAGTPATVTILDDDAPMVATLVVASTVTEGTGGTNFLQAQITLSRTSTLSTFVQFDTIDGSANSAGNSDFIAQSVGVTFLPGATGPATINIPITTDDVDEPDESFSVSLSNPSLGVTIAGSPSTVTILDDDAPLVATLTLASSVVEGTGGTNFLPAQITLSRPSIVTFTLTLTTTDGSASSSGGADYTAQTVGVTFLAGATGPGTINIPITTDSAIEDNETFVTTLSTLAPGVTIAGSPTTTTIIDDDDTTRPTVTIEQAATQADPTHASSIKFTATFDEPVVGFTGSDVSLSGTAGATTAVVTGGPQVFTVTVTGMSQPGTVLATLAAGVAADGHGNTNTAATSLDATVTYLGPARAPTLAATGVVPGPPARFAGALIVLGVALLFAGRSRRRPLFV